METFHWPITPLPLHLAEVLAKGQAVTDRALWVYGCGVGLIHKLLITKHLFLDVTDLPSFWRRKLEVRKFLPVFEDNIDKFSPAPLSAPSDKV